MKIEGKTMHVRQPGSVAMTVDTCPERDVILRWYFPESTPDTLRDSIEVSAEQAIEYANQIIKTAKFVMVRSVMLS